MTCKKSAKRVRNTNYARNETCVEVYSCLLWSFHETDFSCLVRQPFRTGSGKVTKSKGFSRKKNLMRKQYELQNVCR